MTFWAMDAAVLLRMLTTCIVVVTVSWSVGVLGPLVGGALAGVPMVLGPAFFFLAHHAPAEFVATMATYALISLSATQNFLLAYMAASRTLRPLASLACALAAWILAATLGHWVPSSLGWACALFIACTGTAWAVSKSWVQAAAPMKRATAWPSLIVRGLLAGLLVATITTASSWLGASSAGILLAFPIGYTVIAITIHEKLGSATVINTLHAALLGTVSLAVFCLTMAITITRLSAHAALATSMAAALAVTLILVLRNRQRQRQRVRMG